MAIIGLMAGLMLPNLVGVLGTNYKKATYYATGNKWNPPGKLELEKIDLTGDQQEQLIRVCRQAAELWKETRFDIDATVAWQAPPPLSS